MRKKDDTLQATLLELARRTADEEGIAAINIRYLARKAGVATGTVYNYFSSKDEILLAITEEYWKQTLAEMENVITARTFCGQLCQIPVLAVLMNIVFFQHIDQFRERRRNKHALLVLHTLDPLV